MRELGWPVPVFLCADGGGGRTEKHAVFPLRVYSMFFRFYGGDRFCKVLMLFKMDTRIVLIFFRVDTK